MASEWQRCEPLLELATILTRHRLFKTSQGASELFIGGTNPKHYTGPIEYHPVLKQAYFNISGQPFLNGVGVLGLRTTVIDTGAHFVEES